MSILMMYICALNVTVVDTNEWPGQADSVSLFLVSLCTVSSTCSSSNNIFFTHEWLGRASFNRLLYMYSQSHTHEHSWDIDRSNTEFITLLYRTFIWLALQYSRKLDFLLYTLNHQTIFNEVTHSTTGGLNTILFNCGRMGNARSMRWSTMKQRSHTGVHNKIKIYVFYIYYYLHTCLWFRLYIYKVPFVFILHIFLFHFIFSHLFWRARCYHVLRLILLDQNHHIDEWYECTCTFEMHMYSV